MTKQEKVIEYINKLKDNNKITQGSFIPSEHYLMLKLGYSRNTIRSALLKLVEVNILIPIKGKGYRYNFDFAPILRDFKKEYGAHSNTIFIKKRYVDEYENILKEYGYWELIKTRYNEKNEPFILTYQRISKTIMNKLNEDDYQVSLYKALKKKHFKISFAEKQIEYVNTPKEVKFFLPELQNHSLLLTSITKDKNNVILEVSHNYYYPDKFKWKWIEKSYE